jgi:hypothetical protein
MAVSPRLIVPLHGPEEEAHKARFTATAHLNYHNGPLLTNVQVVTIFWGAAWSQPAESGLIPQINQFFDYILTSTLIDSLAEYGVSGKTIGHGSRIGTATITASEPGSNGQVTDAQIQQALQQWTVNGAVPPVTSNTLYFVYLPAGVTVALGADHSCQVFCGYHSNVSNRIFYAVEPYLDCNGCTFGSNPSIDSLTQVSSHELCEAITDPAGNGWYDDTSGDEIGDICNGPSQQLGGFNIQGEWSNQANACVIKPPAGIIVPPPTAPQTNPLAAFFQWLLGLLSRLFGGN